MYSVYKRYIVGIYQGVSVLFEYDPEKSESNLAKHGIDFLEAQELWEDLHAVKYGLACTGEARYGLIAPYGGRYWFAVFTIRNENVRIISVRAATMREVSLYDRAYND